MTSLAGTTDKLRSILKIAGIIGAVLFLIYLIFIGGVFIKNIFFPTPPAPPAQGYGQIPELVFNIPTNQSVNYVVNTASGQLPLNFPDRMLVYKIAQPKPDLLALQNARQIAVGVGFTNQELKISDVIYQWVNPSTNATLQMDIISKNLEIRSNYLFNSLITNSVFPEEEDITKDVNKFMTSLHANISALNYKENSFIYYSIKGNNLEQTNNKNNANVVRVNLYNNNIQNDLGDFPFVYPNQEFPNVHILLSYPSKSRPNLLEGDVYDYQILTEENSDYPIKSATEALDELKNGNGYLFNPNNSSNIQITGAYLAYYLDKNTSQFLQPVIVFNGIDSSGGNIIAYIPAIKSMAQIEEPISE